MSDFFDIDYEPIKKIKKTKKKNISLYKTNYSFDTINKYVSLRQRIIDPITLLELDKGKSFEFPYMWDPYTGERLNVDPYGPIYFNPNVLIKQYYENRLIGLWNETNNGNNGNNLYYNNNGFGLFEGYYDYAIGNGSDIYIEGRGHHPERYVFRLPYLPCYLTDDHQQTIITMCPLLTNEEILLIDNLSSDEEYNSLFGEKRPNLTRMKYYYDQALSKNPDVSEEITQMKIPIGEKYSIANRQAVEELKKM